MNKLWGSIAFRLALICGALVIGSITVFALVFYIGTVGVLNEQIDLNIVSISQRLIKTYERNGLEALQREINSNLNDKTDSETEIYFLESPGGQKIVGNLSSVKLQGPLEKPLDQKINRDGRRIAARLLLHKLPDGSLLVVGRYMQDLNKIESLVWRTIFAGMITAVVLAVGGTFFFRFQLECRVGAIRRSVEEIEAGDLTKRIPIPKVDDEFARLGGELNRMLDKIEHLMDGVRHISNTVAHNIRTPLGRIRGYLDEALRTGADPAQLTKAASISIEQVDALTVVFDKLLQIAEYESLTRRRPFNSVALREIIINVVELYDAMAEAHGITLMTKIEGNPQANGDKDLLATAFANMIDNALKYGARSVTIGVQEIIESKIVSVQVRDDGPGIPAEEREKVIQRFYRCDHTVPGSGLGLSIVSAIAHLHGASLHFHDDNPGLMVCFDLPIISSF